MRKSFLGNVLRPLVPLCFVLLSSCTFVIRTPAVPPPKAKGAVPLRGVFHVHTEYSHDSKASLELILKTARQAGLDFVVVTDHNNMKAAARYEQMDQSERPLLIFGDEISTWHDGHLVALGIEEEPPNIEETQEIVDLIHEQGGFTIPAHPFSPRKPWTNWNIKNFDGLEVFCFSDIFYSEGIMGILPKALFLTPRKFLRSLIETPEAALKLWDDELRSGRHVAAFGSTDAHLKWQWNDIAFENLLLYFQSVTMYVFADAFESKKITEALGRGRSFIAFEVRGIAQEFSFTAARENETYMPGDSVSTENVPIFLKIEVPEPAHIRLIHNGKVLAEGEGKTLRQEIAEPGTYRVEVYREGGIWIISNPIYVETSS